MRTTSQSRPAISPAGRNLTGHDRWVQRQQLQERPVGVFHRDEAAGFGHAAELAHDTGEFRLRQVLSDIGAPHALEGRVGKGEVQHAADLNIYGHGAVSVLDEAFDPGDTLRRQIDRGDLP